MSAIWDVSPLAERRKKDWPDREGDDRLGAAAPGHPLSFPWICEAIRRMTRDETALALTERIIPIAWAPGVAFFAAGARAARRAMHRGLELEAVIDDATLLDALQRTKDADLRDHAVWALADRGEEYSASQPVTPSQVRCGLVLLLLVCLAFGLFPGFTLALAGFALAMFFLLVIGLKFMSLWPTAQAPASLPLHLPNPLLPTYSVLVPLFRETEVAEQLLDALCRLDYPAFGSKRTKIASALPC